MKKINYQQRRKYTILLFSSNSETKPLQLLHLAPTAWADHPGIFRVPYLTRLFMIGPPPALTEHTFLMVFNDDHYFWSKSTFLLQIHCHKRPKHRVSSFWWTYLVLPKPIRFFYPKWLSEFDREKMTLLGYCYKTTGRGICSRMFQDFGDINKIVNWTKDSYGEPLKVSVSTWLFFEIVGGGWSNTEFKVKASSKSTDTETQTPRKITTTLVRASTKSCLQASGPLPYKTSALTPCMYEETRTTPQRLHGEPLKVSVQNGYFLKL